MPDTDNEGVYATDEGAESPSSEAPAVAEATDGQAASDTDATTEQPWDYSEYADKRVAVKVQGETQYVPLQEAVQGYQRQSDYTRKAQAIAQREQELEYADAVYKAMQLDPERTIQYLQEQFVPATQDAAQEPEFLDEEQQKIAELEAWREQQEQRALQMEIQSEIAALEGQYGDTFVADDVLQYAIQGDYPNLTSAFRDMHFDTAWNEAKAVRDTRAAKEAERAQAEANARAQLPGAAVVHSGTGHQGGATSQGQPDGLMSVREAFERASQSV